MKARHFPRLAMGSLVVLVAISVVNASAATNTVPSTSAGQSDTALLISQMAPPECAGMGLTRLQIGGSGSGGGNALILGDNSGQTLSGGGGDDCIVAGAGSDTLNGQGGNDVLISGDGIVDWINGGGGYDVCYGEGVQNWPSSCEEYYP